MRCSATSEEKKRKNKREIFIRYSAIGYAVTTKVQEEGESQSNDGTLRHDEENESDERR